MTNTNDYLIAKRNYYNWLKTEDSKKIIDKISFEIFKIRHGRGSSNNLSELDLILDDVHKYHDSELIEEHIKKILQHFRGYVIRSI